jgi:hypothetical protein
VLTLLKAFWPYIVGGLLVSYAAYWHIDKVGDARDAGYKQAMSEVDLERTREKERTDKLQRDSSSAYQTTLLDLETRLSILQSEPRTPIRVCKPATLEVRVPVAATGPDDRAPVDRHADQDGPDLRGRLERYAAESEKLRLQVIGLQQYAKGLSSK